MNLFYLRLATASDGTEHARSPKPARPRLKMRCPKEPEHHFQNSGLPEARPILILKPDGLFGLSGFWGMGIFSQENTDLANDILLKGIFLGDFRQFLTFFSN